MLTALGTAPRRALQPLRRAPEPTSRGDGVGGSGRRVGRGRAAAHIDALLVCARSASTVARGEAPAVAIQRDDPRRADARLGTELRAAARRRLHGGARHRPRRRSARRTLLVALARLLVPRAAPHVDGGGQTGSNRLRLIDARVRGEQQLRARLDVGREDLHAVQALAPRVERPHAVAARQLAQHSARAAQFRRHRVWLALGRCVPLRAARARRADGNERPRRVGGHPDAPRADGRAALQLLGRDRRRVGVVELTEARRRLRAAHGRRPAEVDPRTGARRAVEPAAVAGALGTGGAARSIRLDPRVAPRKRRRPPVAPELQRARALPRHVGEEHLAAAERAAVRDLVAARVQRDTANQLQGRARGLAVDRTGIFGPRLVAQAGDKALCARAAVER